MNELYIVGIGPGAKNGMTFEAAASIEQSDIIVGYTKYVDLLRPHYPDKEYFQTPMLGEVERCEKALELAESGKTVAVICSGDSGVYGMAGLIYELSVKHEKVNIIPVAGVSAAMSGAALLGAPLGHDFAVISLSDMLIPWESIEKRLVFAAQADFCLCIYNPASNRRRDYLLRACDILLKLLPSERPCGISRNIGREGESSELLTLGELRDTPVDMFCTVFIGNSQTRVINGKMVTPRGYKNV
ncbi:MAG: precorrin-3B C(17)-methyltransferase [Oscillospiraceae bacterium]|nr:precorrin-3B C(17)-methyltransferase [Oscillospiraceae bacterium]